MGLLIKPFIGILANGFALYLVIELVEGITYTGGFLFFVIAGIVLGLVNLIVKPIIKIVSLPFIFITGGLFLIVINVGVLWFFTYFLEVAEFRDLSLDFQNFSSYVIGAVVFGIINWGVNLID